MVYKRPSLHGLGALEVRGLGFRVYKMVQDSWVRVHKSFRIWGCGPRIYNSFRT